MLVKLTTTRATLIFNSNRLRKRLFLQMQPVNVDSTNTGRIFVGKGFQPVATVGHPSQGEVLLAGATIEEIKEFEGDTRPYKGPIWVTSDTLNQTIVVEEEIEERLI